MLEFTIITCPYCGESFEINVDVSSGATSYIEDCQVCCKPIELRVRVDAQGEFVEVDARRGDA